MTVFTRLEGSKHRLKGNSAKFTSDVKLEVKRILAHDLSFLRDVCLRKTKVKESNL